MQIFKPDDGYCRECLVDERLVWRTEESCRLDNPGAGVEVLDFDDVDDAIFAD